MTRILLFGTYDPWYSRNRVITKGLKSAGFDVAECHDKFSIFGLFRLAAGLIKRRKNFDILFVLFPGQEVMLIARLFTSRPIVFDAFTSHYEGYVLDRKKYKPGSMRAKWYRLIDRVSCALADVVLLDTNAHVEFFVRQFGLQRKKFRVVYVGTDDDVFVPRENSKPHKRFLVHFHGHYIPLHGARYIIEAASMIKGRGIHFRMIGKGQEYDIMRKLAHELNADNITFIGNVPYDDLPKYIAEADVCLGIFGDTPKTGVVIPNKVFESIACARPVITADTPAIREMFHDGHDIIFVPAANANALATAILRLRDDEELRKSIAHGGHELFAHYFTRTHISSVLKDIVYNIQNHAKH